MSHLSLKRKRNSVGGNVRSRICTQSTVPEEQKENFNLDQNIDQNLNSIKDTITMLKEYQKVCIEKEDFLMAQETKNKIQFLEIQQKSIQKERGVLKEQQNIETVCKQGEQEVQNFQTYWDQTVKNLIQELKEIEKNFIKQQEVDLAEYKEKISTQEGPKMKYSSKVLELRKNLTNLIKLRKYKEADEIKSKLKALELQCESTWGAKIEDRLKILLQKFQKKQKSQLKALRIKLEAVFNQKIKQRDDKFEMYFLIIKKIAEEKQKEADRVIKVKVAEKQGKPIDFRVQKSKQSNFGEFKDELSELFKQILRVLISIFFFCFHNHFLSKQR